MKTTIKLIVAVALLNKVTGGWATTHYVDLNSPSAASPFTNWTTAAHIIQDAVDASAPGDDVLVTNGIYAEGGRPAASFTLTNRVVVDKPVWVHSVNGAEVTIIQGWQPRGVSGPDAIRCAYLASGASLSGLTLTNGATDFDTDLNDESGGGIWCQSALEVVSNCVLTGNSAWGPAGGSYQGTLYNCIVSTNLGGGTVSSTLINCSVVGNSGTGATEATLIRCTVSGNSGGWAGGADGCTLEDCLIVGNAGPVGSGVAGDELFPCVLRNCVLAGNSVTGLSFSPAGAAAFGESPGDCILQHCIVSGNGPDGTPALSSCFVTNSIVYANEGENYDSLCRLSYCCTFPLPAGGVGNISADPHLTDSTHFSTDSPCIGAGDGSVTGGADLDGEPWASPPSIGCNEFRIGPVTGPLDVAFSPSYTNVAAGFDLLFRGLVTGQATVSFWDFGDGSVAVDEPYVVRHAFSAPGDYVVSLVAFNENHLAGVIETQVIHVAPLQVHYASAMSTNASFPYISWSTAASNIQDAVDAATVGDVVLVTNGCYATGGQRLVTRNPLTLVSVNGPEFTLIDGGYSDPCAYLVAGTSMTGFTFTNGGGVDYSMAVWCGSKTATLSNCVISAGRSGVAGGSLYDCTLSSNSWRGAYYSTLDNCLLVGNRGGAENSILHNCVLIRNTASDGDHGKRGGGAYGGTLSNCLIISNTAPSDEVFPGYGGGADGATLNGCILVGNTPDGANGCWLENCTIVRNGRGITWSLATNCIVYFNGDGSGQDDYDVNASLSWCCTTLLPTNGIGNITNTPLFVDPAGGDLRLQSNSPCINAGNNTYAPPGPDLDGNPRIAGGTVDIGAYEFQNPASIISYAWLQQYGLRTDGADDFKDPDGDGMNNWQEWRCGTNPTNGLSALRMISALPTGTNVTVSWQSVAGINYFLESSTNLLGPAPVFTPVAAGIPGQDGTTSYFDTNSVGPAPVLYRVGVGN